MMGGREDKWRSQGEGSHDAKERERKKRSRLGMANLAMWKGVWVENRRILNPVCKIGKSKR